MAHNIRENRFNGKWQLTLTETGETYMFETKEEALEYLVIAEAKKKGEL